MFDFQLAFDLYHYACITCCSLNRACVVDLRFY